MQNHRLGIHGDVIWADSATKNALKYIKKKPFLINLPNRPKYLGYFLKEKLSLCVHSSWLHISPQMCNNFG